MKRALVIILTIISALTIAVPQAKADHAGCTRIVSYTSCGRPVYAVYQVVGYDRCGHPVGRWVTQSSNCGCEVCHPRPRYDYQPSYGHQDYGHSHSRPSCGSSYQRSGFYFSFGR